jgi:predicted membrane channel-forming protein YqfA (hemolysin III family)
MNYKTAGLELVTGSDETVAYVTASLYLVTAFCAAAAGAEGKQVSSVRGLGYTLFGMSMFFLASAIAVLHAERKTIPGPNGMKLCDASSIIESTDSTCTAMILQGMFSTLAALLLLIASALAIKEASQAAAAAPRAQSSEQGGTEGLLDSASALGAGKP